MRLIDAYAYIRYCDDHWIPLNVAAVLDQPTVDAVLVVRCKDCKHNPKETWFECPMAHLSEKQRPDDAWCWKGERKE